MAKAKKLADRVAILMGSHSDLPLMQEAGDVLKQLGIGYEMRVLSAHRTPKEAVAFVEEAPRRGIKLFIAGAGGAAHLAGIVSAHTVLPVIGVPIANGPLNGVDALYSTVQMPRGVPVATVAIGNAWNAGLLAASILSLAEPELQKKLEKIRNDQRKKILETP